MANVVCWSCRGVTGPGLFCRTCDAILPVDHGVDFFRLFGLEVGFVVDRTLLEERYRELQKRLHPDFFASRGAMERRLSLEHVTRVNEALRTLTHPLERAGYLLRLAGWQEEKIPPDTAFLAEVMEQREALDEVDPGAGDAHERLATLRAEAEQRARAEEARLAEMFVAAFGADGQEWLPRIARHTDRLRYHQRFLEELDRLEDQAFE
ncbi:MAG: Fe-S protein assembly co-chaperone HscB [Magnetococcales bacterium]|nr:Fe-S protein assembly co-chaperone HscB [Magnetococcales bacterium]